MDPMQGIIDYDDELDFYVVAASIDPDLGMDHGSVTVRIVAPRYVTHEFTRKGFTLESVMVSSFHKPMLGPLPESVFERAAQDTWLYYQELINMDVPPECAVNVLSDHVKVQFVLTLTGREIVEHLLQHNRHSEPTQLIDQGLMRTLDELSPTVAAHLRQSLPEGVLRALSDQEEMSSPTAGGPS